MKYKYIHIVGMPRSGTTALSQKIHKITPYKLITEPIHVWSDFFHLDIINGRKFEERELSTIINNCENLRRRYSEGFVEKTPSSIFLGENIFEILSDKDSCIILITRDMVDVRNSLRNKVISKIDNNTNYNLFFHNLRIRIVKLLEMVQSSPIKSILGLIKFSKWKKRFGNSILNLSVEEIDMYLIQGQIVMDEITSIKHPQLLKLPYCQLRNDQWKRNVSEFLACDKIID